MKSSIKVTLAALGLGAAAFACGPFFWIPDFANLEILGPRLGTVLGLRDTDTNPLYYLLAYRRLVGSPITAAEQAALRQAWPSDELSGTGADAPEESPALQVPARNWITNWVGYGGELAGDAEGQNEGAPGGSFGRSAYGVYKTSLGKDSWQAFLNCPEDAFHTAVLTREDRALRYPSGEQLTAWTQAQAEVFDNCADTGEHIPEALTEGPPLAIADRNYQRAAALLYAGHYDAAASAFLAIANDAGSPWHDSAGYLAARAWVRAAGEVGTPPFGFQDASAQLDARKTWLQKANSQLDAVLRDRGEEAWWGPARRLQAYVAIRLDPSQRFLQLADKLQAPADPDFGQDTVDFSRLMGVQLPPDAPRNDLYTWIEDFGNGFASCCGESFRQWQLHPTTVWLVAALQDFRETQAQHDAMVSRNFPNGPPPNWPKVFCCGIDSPNAAAVLAAAARVGPTSPAYDSVLAGKFIIEHLQGHDAQIQSELASAPIADAPEATRNYFQAIKFASAQTIEQAIVAAPRQDGAYIGFDDDVPQFLNRDAPLAVLEQFAQSPALLAALANEVALAAWTRALLLDDGAAAREMETGAVARLPELQPHAAAYDTAPTESERHFDAAWAWLHFHDLTPAVLNRDPAESDLQFAYGGNWWGTDAPAAYPEYGPWWWGAGLPTFQPGNMDMYKVYPQPSRAFAPPPLVAAAMAQAASSELDRIRGLGTGADVFCHWVLGWVRLHPEDQRAAEALALAVRATQWGEGDAQTGDLSKACFDFLHEHYGATTWSGQVTRYYSGYKLCGKDSFCDG